MLKHSLNFQSRVIIAFACVYLIWGSTYLAIRFTIETLPPFLSAGIRSLLAGLILYAVARRRSKEKITREHWQSAFIIGGLLILGGNGSVVWAQRYIPSGVAALFIAITPLWMVLLQWLWQRGKRPSAGILFGIGLGVLGVWLLMAPDSQDLSSFPFHIGAALVLLFASLSWAIGSVYSRKAPLPASPFLSTGMQLMAGGILLALAGFVRGEAATLNPAAFSLKSIAAFVYLVLAGSLIGFTAYIWLLKNVGVAKASTYAFVNPIVAVFLGYALAGEKLTSQTALAACFVIIAVIVITLSPQNTEVERPGNHGT